VPKGRAPRVVVSLAILVCYLLLSATIADAEQLPVTFTVGAATCAVVSSDGRIIEVWTNTHDPSIIPAFARDHVGGERLESTEALLKAYRAMAWRIDWSRNPGRVYQASDSPFSEELINALATVWLSAVQRS
jgi:hypothetical protein